jgi:ribosomal protein S18 acetylase RimI-like enzyme
VGTALWERARTSFQKAAYSDVTLWVFERNDLARRFYEKAGFRLERKIEKTLERGGETFRAVRYRHNLQASITSLEPIPEKRGGSAANR